jgi:hypothetical protein
MKSWISRFSQALRMSSQQIRPMFARGGKHSIEIEALLIMVPGLGPKSLHASPLRS